MKKLPVPWACDGFRCRIKRRRVRNANDVIDSAGFVVDNGGGPGCEGRISALKRDMVCVGACNADSTACSAG